MSCQIAASKKWNIFHIDLKTAFFQGQSYGVNRDVVCRLPPVAGHPPYIAARLKKPAYGMNDHPDAGGTFLTRHCVVMAWFPHELVDAVTCCTLYSRVSELRTKSLHIVTMLHLRKSSFRNIRGRNY